MAFSLVLDQAPEYWLLAVTGELDYGECSQVRLSLHRILNSNIHSAIIDLSGLDYLDSSGLGVLLAMSKEYGSFGGRLVLVTNAVVNELLAIVRITSLFITVPTREEAMLILTSDDYVGGDANKRAGASRGPSLVDGAGVER
jgi:anti-sigma B factor antagonist